MFFAGTSWMNNQKRARNKTKISVNDHRTYTKLVFDSHTLQSNLTKNPKKTPCPDHYNTSNSAQFWNWISAY